VASESKPIYRTENQQGLSALLPSTHPTRYSPLHLAPESLGAKLQTPKDHREHMPLPLPSPRRMDISRGVGLAFLHPRTTSSARPGGRRRLLRHRVGFHSPENCCIARSSSLLVSARVGLFVGSVLLYRRFRRLCVCRRGPSRNKKPAASVSVFVEILLKSVKSFL
jgi:hypothetical protein